MGGLAQLMGGKSSSNGNMTSSSDGSSQNSSVNASQSTSNQQSSNASGSANRAYGELNSALAPSLGYVNSAGGMIGALLGLPPSTFTPQASSTNVLPAMPGAHAPAHTPATGGSMIDKLFQDYMKQQAAAPVATTPVPGVPAPAPAPVAHPPASGGGGLGGSTNYRALGGPVAAGQPYVVGEHQAEVFVPHTSGTILPSAPPGLPTNTGVAGQAAGLGGRLGLGDLAGRFSRGGHGMPTPPIMGGGPIPGTPAPAPGPAAPPAYTPPVTPSSADALNSWANSSGQNFILDEGQKAISGASASNGTFDSGATGKALVNYGQNVGKTTLNDYMNHLFDYAKLGLGSASALSGAGGVSQGVGTSSGGSSSTSFGNSQGSSDQTSDSTSTTKSKSKQGLGI
jgi:hypothetical protein